MRIVLADEQEILRDGLRCLFSDDPAVEIAGEAATADDLLALLPSIQPDVTLVDLDMRGSGGINIVPKILERCSTTRVVVLTLFEDHAFASRVIDAGAAGCISKRASFEDVRSALRELMNRPTTVSITVPVKREGAPEPAPRPAPAPAVAV
jgi:DNA-binding NarL/FixJ family response regulator